MMDYEIMTTGHSEADSLASPILLFCFDLLCNFNLICGVPNPGGFVGCIPIDNWGCNGHNQNCPTPGPTTG